MLRSSRFTLLLSFTIANFLLTGCSDESVVIIQEDVPDINSQLTYEEIFDDLLDDAEWSSETKPKITVVSLSGEISQKGHDTFIKYGRKVFNDYAFAGVWDMREEMIKDITDKRADFRKKNYPVYRQQTLNCKKAKETLKRAYGNPEKLTQDKIDTCGLLEKNDYKKQLKSLDKEYSIASDKANKVIAEKISNEYLLPVGSPFFAQWSVDPATKAYTLTKFKSESSDYNDFPRPNVVFKHVIIEYSKSM